MKALVTGAGGFAGGHLCRYLLAREHTVVGLVRSSEDARGLEELGIQPARGDVRDPASLTEAARGAEVVFHLAAVFRQAGLPDDEFEAVNVGGTENVIRAAAEAGARRVVHCSTIGVVGDTGSVPADESRAPQPAADSYNRTKALGEHRARGLFEELGIEGVVVRPGAGYGPGELRYLKLFRAISKQRFFILGDGETLFNLAWIDDLCEAFRLCAESPDAPGRLFHLGGDTNVTLNELTREIARAVGVDSPRIPRFPAWPVVLAARAVEACCRPFGIEPPLHRRRVEFFTVSRAIDIGRARTVLGYRPRVPLREGLGRMAAWYQSEGLL